MFYILPNQQLPKPPQRSTDKFQYLLGSYSGAYELVKWMRETEFFTEICPRFTVKDDTFVDYDPEGSL